MLTITAEEGNMGNIVIFVVLIIWVFVGIRRIYRTVRYGGSCCSGSSGMEKKVRVRDRKKSNYPYSYKLKVMVWYVPDVRERLKMQSF